MKGIFPRRFAFRSTSPARAFLLAAFVQATVAVFAHDGLQNKTSNMYWTFKGLLHENQSPWMKTCITFTSTFIAAIIVMNVMWALFAYGGGMLVGSSVKRVKTWL